MPLALCLIGERFGTPPWELESAPADRVSYYFAVMSAHGDAESYYDGLPSGEDVTVFGDDSE